ncbi:ThiF family adenylyltransferase [Corynebacterium lubricantis]|uniref:ThiF family adenylyltransferase n=1 Tax=Corynebacterium lubricantis TaxID=541095 RepID=UPI0003743390|nr:ThiF family adenylyltransferase [Corynebacterium lubricantis]
MVETQLPEAELHRTARQLALPGFGLKQQKRLHNAHVLVIGAGGLGCPAMQSLASAGVGTISVIDDDTVDLSNIHRQILFGASDVGRVKVEVARERLEELQPGITVHAINDRLRPDNALELFKGVDLVLDGSDSFTTKYLVADAAEITGTPLMWGTVLRFHGDVALFNSSPGHRGVGLRDLFPAQPDADSVPDCATAGVLGATTAVVGSLMATQTIAFLAGLDGVEPGRMLSYDALPATMRSFQIAADPDRELVTKLQPDYGAPTCSIDSATQSLIDDVRAGNLTALDIREPHEILVADLPADAPSVKLPLSTISSEQAVADMLTGHDRMLVYCASGKRSADFVERYRHLGVELISLPGGVSSLN